MALYLLATEFETGRLWVSVPAAGWTSSQSLDRAGPGTTNGRPRHFRDFEDLTGSRRNSAIMVPYLEDCAMDKPVTPARHQPLVLNVRDIEENRIRFWHRGSWASTRSASSPRPRRRPNRPTMRFYAGVPRGRTSHHHDVALVENRDLPKPPENWSMFGCPVR